MKENLTISLEKIPKEVQQKISIFAQASGRSIQSYIHDFIIKQIETMNDDELQLAKAVAEDPDAPALADMETLREYQLQKPIPRK